jgi:hypothetical protein
VEVKEQNNKVTIRPLKGSMFEKIAYVPWYLKSRDLSPMTMRKTRFCSTPSFTSLHIAPFRELYLEVRAKHFIWGIF